MQCLGGAAWEAKVIDGLVSLPRSCRALGAGASQGYSCPVTQLGVRMPGCA